MDRVEREAVVAGPGDIGGEDGKDLGAEQLRALGAEVPDGVVGLAQAAG